MHKFASRLLAIVIFSVAQNPVPQHTASQSAVVAPFQCVINASDKTPEVGQIVHFSVESPAAEMIWDFDDGTGLLSDSDHAFTALGTHLVETMGRVTEWGTVRCLSEITVHPAQPKANETPEPQLPAPAPSAPATAGQQITVTGDNATIVIINGDSAQDINVGASSSVTDPATAEPELNFLQRIWLAVRTFFKGIAESFDVLFDTAQ